MARRGRRAFTLIELLVVVAIIALLISILVPSLGLARARSRATTCLSNLHQLGRAFQQYLLNNGDALPAAAQLPTIDRENPDANDRHPPIMDFLRPYTTVPELFRCPADTPGRTERDTLDPNIVGKSYWQSEGTSYEYNYLATAIYDVSSATGETRSFNVGDTIAKVTPPLPGRFGRWMNRKIYDVFLLREYDPFHGRRGNPNYRRSLEDAGTLDLQEIRHTLYADFHVEDQFHWPFNVDPNAPYDPNR
jgi:prepilin-type N-terminal cleavage/methylation domain-containing protein